MISYYKAIDKKLTKLDKYEEHCWINCTSPDEDDVDLLINEFGVSSDFIRAALDEEESSRAEREDDYAFVIVDIPVEKKNDKTVTYSTAPLAIMVTDTNIVTVSIKGSDLINDFCKIPIKGINTKFKTNFVLLLMLHISKKYLQYLKLIDRTNDRVQDQLRKTMRNQELIQLMDAQTSLVYFQSSLKANEVTLHKIMRGRILKLYEEDQDLLDDVIIEVRQALDMASTYLDVLSATMDAFASIISNNLNIVMKVLASLTLIVSIPTVISGIYGMNTSTLPMKDYFWFPIALSGVLMVIAYIILKKRDML